jgi:hypothetical protein
MTAIAAVWLLNGSLPFDPYLNITEFPGSTVTAYADCGFVLVVDTQPVGQTLRSQIADPPTLDLVDSNEGQRTR